MSCWPRNYSRLTFTPQVVACGVVGGMDLAALLPKSVCSLRQCMVETQVIFRYIDIRRGSFIVAIIGICINPWKILNVRRSVCLSFSITNSTSTQDREFIHLSYLRICCFPGTFDWHHGGKARKFSLLRCCIHLSTVTGRILHSPKTSIQSLSSVHT